MVLAAISSDQGDVLEQIWAPCRCFGRSSSGSEAEFVAAAPEAPSARPVFESLLKQRPSRRPIKDNTKEPRPPPPFGGQKSASVQEDDFEKAECPICCGDLGSSVTEVGALTFKGKRVEKDLYHVGCFTMMLSHNGAFRGQRVGRDQVDNLQISWGTSPTTRQPVDGFTRMPPIEDRKGWVAFLDWKGTGKLDLEELATAAAVLLPLHPKALELFMRENFQVDPSGEISVEELDHKVLPYISEHFDSISDVKEQEKRDAARMRGEMLLQRLEGFCNRATPEQPAQIVTALDELQSCVQEGDALAINVLTRLLTVQQPQVREKAARLLPQIAAKGDQQAFEALSPQLQHSSGHVRQAVLEVLGQIAMTGDRRAFDEVSFLLGDRQPQVKVAAVRCMLQISEVGDERAVQAVCSRLQDRDTSVRCAALEALAKLAERGGQLVLEPVLGALADGEGAVRAAALTSLAELARPGDQTAIQAATAKLEDASAGARRAAVKAVVSLSTCCSKDTRKAALQSVVARLSDGEAEVRSTALHVLAPVCEKDDRAVIGLVCPKLQDSAPAVRREALLALERIVATADSRTIKAVSALQNDPDLHTLRAAQQVTEKLKKRQKSGGFFGFVGRRG